MATATTPIFVKLQDQLTCRKCHNLYTNPKTLSCHHSFCQECIEGLATIPTFSVACPTCHQHTELPDHAGAAGLSLSTNVQEFKKIYNELSSGEVKCDNCSNAHPAVYCQECNRYLCNECVSTHNKWSPFSGHTVNKLSDVKAPTSPLDGEVELQIRNAFSAAEIRDQGERVKEEMMGFTQTLMAGIQEEFTRKLEELVQMRLQNHREGRNTSYLVWPRETASYHDHDDILFIKNSSKEFTISQHVGNVMSRVDLAQCRVKEIVTITHIPEDREVSFRLSIEVSDYEKSLLIVPTSSIFIGFKSQAASSPVIKARVISTDKPGVYQVICTPVIRGRHQVNVRVSDVSLQGTSLLIPFNPYSYLFRVTPARTIYDLDRPSGVAVHNDGRIIVSEYSPDLVSILSKEGKKLKSFGKGVNAISFSYNHGIAITKDGSILIADSNNHRIQKISMNGIPAASFPIGRSGTGVLEFKYPTGIAVSPIKNRVYIADSKNHRVQVLNSDLTFCRIFGRSGTSSGEFNAPLDIAIDSEGLVYVTDQYNHRVQKFNPDGVYMCQFGSEGSGSGQLKQPAGIAVDNAGLVYVTEYGNHCVSIFTSDGSFVRSFGEYGINEDQFKNPYVGICFDSDGYLYICDYYNSRIVVY
ncbi:PREDICTED: RING finger protein nhl-1-like [Amphimedon queenslandica]|uniref:RING-type domain-containing protein n=1 Tax=Amphimedon queenslandica TaxID=400682 RepID=A0A1X7U178_AMPQE|nr:PREDICTED: RING finger protein nhl-1-like [Amphimedon queenslandica]|eukprot:XP_011406324.1 PREDICTED: RING finger protein nhl-1-like [Amphimedon queenslandica]